MSHQEHGVYQINRIFTESGGTYQIHPVGTFTKFIHLGYSYTIPWLWMLGDQLSLQKHGFDSRPLHMEFVVEMGKVFLQILWFSPVSYHSTTAQYPYITNTQLILYNLGNWHHNFSLKTMLSCITMTKCY
jgi:hypothetical protein